MRLQNKVAVVTGAKGAIGDAICERFKKEGATVIGIDLEAPLTCDMNIACDLSDTSIIEDTGRRITSAYEQIDILVHAAGMSDLATTVDTNETNFNRVMAVNVYSAMQLTSLLHPHFKQNDTSAIVLISSITGLVGAPNMAAYSASKGALHTCARTMALELAPDNIRVNTVSPASIDTPMLRDKLAKADDPEDALRNNIARHPLGRLGLPEDVANLVLFLSSDEACWLTGADYRVDGGATINRK